MITANNNNSNNNNISHSFDVELFNFIWKNINCKIILCNEIKKNGIREKCLIIVIHSISENSFR